MSARSRLILGALAVAAGIAAWVSGQVGQVTAAAVSTDPWALRWSAVALAVGGLVLVARGWRRGVAWALGLGLAWLVVDATLASRGGTAGTVATALSVVVAAAAVVLLVAARHRGDGPARAPALLAYAGLLVTGWAFVGLPIAVLDIGDARSVWAAACGMLVLACALALAAGPLRVSRGRRIVATAVAAGMLVPPLLTGAREPEPQWWLLYLVLAGCPIALVMLVVLTGPLPRGRRVRTLAVLVVASFPIFMTILFGITVVGPLSSPGQPLLQAIATTVDAALVGVVTVVGAGLVRATASPAGPTAPAAPAPPAAVRPAEAPPGADWRPMAGVAIAVVGVAAWLVMALWVHPAISALRAYWYAQGGQPPYGEYATADFAGIGWDARLSAIVLAAGGLRLAARTRARRRVVLPCVGAWVALDVLLFGGGVAEAAVRPIALVVAVAVVAGVLVLAAVPVPRGAAETGHRSPWSLVYCGVSGGVGVLLLQDVDTWMYANLAPWMMPAICALSVALVVAAVLTALSAATRGRLVAPGGAGFAIVVTATVAALDLVRVAGQLRPDGPRELAGGLVLGGLVLGCAVLGGYVPIRTPPRGWAGTVGATVLGGPIAVAGAVVVAEVGKTLLDVVVEVTRVVRVNTPFATGEGASPLTLAGLFAGATLAVAALLPRALSTSEPPTAVPAPPSTPAPANRPAPVAVPGVPEILEWPVSG